MMKIMRLLSSLLVIVLFTSGCANSSKFICLEALGAHCTSLREVDQMVDSGEIEKYYEDKGRGCLLGRGNKNNKHLSNGNPSLANQQEIKAKIIEQKPKNTGVREGDYLYVK